MCPVDATHGPVLGVKDPTSRFGWLCPHAGHDGRLPAHPAGASPRTRALFTTAEVDLGSLTPAARPGLDDSTAGLGAGARGGDRVQPGLSGPSIGTRVVLPPGYAGPDRP